MADHDAAALGRIPIDLRIGVTGHRWIPSDDAATSAVVGAMLDELMAAANHSTRATQVGCTVVSSLAEGADRLVARIGLERGARLEVVLPMQVDEYRKDFGTAESRREFQSLLDRAVHVEIVEAAATRTDAYRSAGEAIANRVDVLVALWDGAAASGAGGTADTVEYAERTKLPTCVIAVAPHQPPRVSAGASELKFVGPMTPSAFARLDRHNRMRLRAKELQQAEFAALEEEAAWLPYYRRADRLAIRHQQRYRRLMLLMSTLALLAVGIAALAVFGAKPSWAFVELFILILLVVTLFVAKRTDPLGRWTAARFVAERLRSAMFLAEVGATPAFTIKPGGTSDEWARADWTNRALRELWYRTHVIKEWLPPLAAVAHINDGWITPQLEYHHRTLEVAGRKRKIASLSSVFLFFTSMLAALMHGLEPSYLDGSGKEWMAYLSIVVPAVTSAVTGYAAQREYARGVLRSRQAIRDLDTLRSALDAADGLDNVQSVAARMDALMHNDAFEWFVTANLHEPELQS